MIEKLILLDEIDSYKHFKEFFKKVETKIRSRPDYTEGPYFSVEIRSLARANENFLTIVQDKEIITDDKIASLIYKDKLVALAFLRRTDSNKTELLLADYSGNNYL